MDHQKPRAYRASFAIVSLAALLIAAAPSPLAAAERVALARETVGSHGDYRFVTEQKMLFEDKATEAIARKPP